MLRRIIEEDPRPLRAINPAVPRELETIVQKATAKEPASRYVTAQELADDLRRFLEHKPIQARRPSLVERAAKWSRRHAAVVVAAVAVLTVAVIALSITTVLVSRKQVEVVHQRDAAESQRQRARRAVDTMYTRVAEHWLANQPGMTEVQHEFLEEALRYYEEFARETGVGAGVDREAACASVRVGLIQVGLGRHRDAEAAYRQAIARLDGSATGPSVSPEDLYELAEAFRNLANLHLVQGRLSEAEAEIRRVIQLAGRLPSGPAAQPGYLLTLADGKGNLGFVLAAEGRATEAEAAYRSALTIYEALAAGATPLPKARANLANLLVNMGNQARRPDG